MATPKRSPNGADSSSEQFGVTGSGGTSGDLHKIGAIQQSVTYLEGFAQDSRKDLRDVLEKLHSLETQIASAKSSFNTAKWFVGIAGTLCVLLWTFVAGIVTLAVKHYMHW